MGKFYIIRSLFISLGISLLLTGFSASQVPDKAANNAGLAISPEFINYDIGEGLSSNVAYAVLEDRRGFIWIGTQDGLNRYDGYDFRVFGTGPEGGKFLSHSGINALLKDQDGNIWIGTEGGGLNYFDPETEKFWHFNHDPDNPQSLSSNTVKSLVQDKNGTIWVGTSNGLNQMHIKYADLTKNPYIKPLTSTFTRYYNLITDPGSISSNRILCMYVDSYKNLWIGTPNGLNMLSPDELFKEKTNFIKYGVDIESPVKLSSNNVNAVFEDDSAILWIGTNNGLTRLSGRNDLGIPSVSQQIQVAPLQEPGVVQKMVYDIIQDTAGNLWLATIGAGLHMIPNEDLYRENDIRFLSYYPDDLDPKSIGDDAINSFMLANSGNIWFSTNNGGISNIVPPTQIFRSMRHNPNNSNSLSHNVVKSICEDRSENLWIGTWGGGLCKYSPKTGKFKNYQPRPGDPDGLGSDIIQVVVEDSKGILWIGTQGMGLYRFNPETEVFTNVAKQIMSGNSLISNDIWSMFPSRNGKDLWIGTYEGLDRYEISSGRITHYPHLLENEHSISFNEIRSLYEDHAGYLWIGTGGGGLDRLNIDEGIFYNFRYNSSDSASLSNNSIYSINADSSGNLWIGTLGGGLNMIEAEDLYSDHPVFKHYGKNEGLANDVVKGTLEDDFGNIWISTSNGLSKLDPRTNTIYNYTESDGLQSNVFNLGAYYKTKSGQLIFGSVNGLCIFSPDDTHENTSAPEVIITDLKISNRSVDVGEKVGKRIILKRSILQTDRIDLSHDSRVISFDFAALAFSARERIKFDYRLQGVDELWSSTDFRRRSITYSNLKPGDYVFEVKASNSDGVFNNDARRISMVIHPAIYRTKIALLVYILLILGGLAYARQITNNRRKLNFELQLERAEFQRREEVDQMKLQFFTNISHEFRTPLTLLLGPLQKLKENISIRERDKQFGIMEKNVNRMLRLVNQIIDFRKMDQGALEFKAAEGDVVNTIKEVCSVFDEMAAIRKIRYDQLYYESEINAWYDHDKIEKILTNILSNAFHYSLDGGKIRVEVDTCNSIENKELSDTLKSENRTAVAEDYFYISVSDTGKGISKEDIDRIFKRFYKVEDSDGTGMGIGLSLVKKLLEMHKAEIHITSEINKGSSFIVYFPMGKEYLGAGEESDTDKTIKHEGSPALQEAILKDEVPEYADNLETIQVSRPSQSYLKKLPLVLLVEDDHDLLEFLHDNLINQYRIHTATDGVQALKSIIINHPELVISDIMMPEMDGIELTKKIKTDIRISHIPVILLTARSTVENRLEGLEVGADAYIAKPFHLKNLDAQIENLLKSRNLLKEKFFRDDQFKPEEISMKSIDQKYIEKAIAIIEKNIDDPVFTVEKFAKEMFDSRVQLYRKLKGLTGLSPNEFVRNIRIKRAAEILIKQGITVGEVMHMVGFSNRSYFNRCFRQVYDTSPLDYQKAHTT